MLEAKKGARMQNTGAMLPKMVDVYRRGGASGGVRGGKPPQIRFKFESEK